MKKLKDLKNRYRYSTILLKQLVKTDFRLRYQGSVLGYLWSLLRPLALFAILYIVFVKFVGVAMDPVALLLGIVLWNYFVEVTVGSVRVFVERGDLIRKINFPKYVIVLAGSFSALINLLLNFVVIAIFMMIRGVELRAVVFTLPLFIAELFIFSLALAFFLSAAFVRFRDISYIWDVVIQGAFYATPILYPLQLVPQATAKFLVLSPMAQIIQDTRYALITPQTQTISGLYNSHLIRVVPVGITIVMVILAVVYFRKRSRYFAEDV